MDWSAPCQMAKFTASAATASVELPGMLLTAGGKAIPWWPRTAIALARMRLTVISSAITRWGQYMRHMFLDARIPTTELRTAVAPGIASTLCLIPWGVRWVRCLTIATSHSRTCAALASGGPWRPRHRRRRRRHHRSVPLAIPTYKMSMVNASIS